MSVKITLVVAPFPGRGLFDHVMLPHFQAWRGTARKGSARAVLGQD